MKQLSLNLILTGAMVFFLSLAVRKSGFESIQAGLCTVFFLAGLGIGYIWWAR